MLVLLQHGLVVPSIAGVMGKEVIEDAQKEADNAHCEEDNAPAVDAKGPVASYSGTDREF